MPAERSTPLARRHSPRGDGGGGANDDDDDVDAVNSVDCAVSSTAFFLAELSAAFAEEDPSSAAALRMIAIANRLIKITPNSGHVEVNQSTGLWFLRQIDFLCPKFRRV